MLDQITHLFRLQAIIEAGSMRRAAEVLNVTQPALTRSIALLEARFGQLLLERHPRGVRPTAFGRTVLQSTRRLSRYWDIVETDLMAARRGEGAMLRITAGPMWRAVVLPPLLAKMQAGFPDLTIELRNAQGDSRQKLLDGETDVTFGGLIFAPAPEHHLKTREFAQVRDQVVAREDHPLFREVGEDGQIDPHRLLDYPWLIYDADPAYRATTLHASVERMGSAPLVRMVCDSLISAIRILQESQCLCVLPHAALTETVNPRLLPLPVDFGRRAVSSGATYREELEDWPPLAALLDLCAKRLK